MTAAIFWPRRPKSLFLHHFFPFLSHTLRIFLHLIAVGHGRTLKRGHRRILYAPPCQCDLLPPICDCWSLEGGCPGLIWPSHPYNFGGGALLPFFVLSSAFGEERPRREGDRSCPKAEDRTKKGRSAPPPNFLGGRLQHKIPRIRCLHSPQGSQIRGRKPHSLEGSYAFWPPPGIRGKGWTTWRRRRAALADLEDREKKC